uniref:Glycolipid transfer protein domain-containing protein n=1 Tax=Haptolina brevifila TaxID=156173 RepID=A0A7S2JSV1_9EUKA|mmetsp:Transcript_87326/g.174419  ORF Transcript_87326/g.174419 Transcript_87326/m.174419 type:complete len:184 (+) Transcript_87326:49-600(+)
MVLIVKCDEANVRTVRQAWERHGRPDGLRTLLEAEVAAGVQQPTRLKEGSAALALLWSMRMKRFWVSVADGIADASGPPSTTVALASYEAEVEPFHGFLLKHIHRPAMQALPCREKLLSRMAVGWDSSTNQPSTKPDSSAPAGSERMEICLHDLRECVEVTRRVVDHVQGLLDELQLHDPRRL